MVLHIIRNDEWEIAKKNGIYNPDSLKKDGFIHCSKIDQIIGVANSKYSGENDLLLLVIDEKKLESRMLLEDLYNYGINFPHIYGNVNLNCIVDIIEFRCNKNGKFKLPKKVSEYK